MPAPRIQPQDPSMSPTFSMSTNQPQHSITGSIRRNLFAGHLSRRAPAATPQNLFRPSSPSNDAQTHSSIFSSAPSAQPSRRNAPFGDIYDPNASPPHETLPISSNTFARESIVALHPLTGRPLLPNIPTLPPRLRLSEGEEDDGGEASDMEQDQQHNPGFAQSPSYHGSRNHVSSAAEFGFEPDMDIDASDLERLNGGTTGYHNNGSSNSANNNTKTSSMRLNIHQFLDTSSEESHADRERIEYLLLEMVSRQSARAKTLPVASSGTTTTAGSFTSNFHTVSSSDPTTMHKSNTNSTASVHPSSRRRAAAAGHNALVSASAAAPTSDSNSIGRNQRFRRAPSPTKSDQLPTQIDHDTPHPDPQIYPQQRQDQSTLPVGKAIDPQEKDELVGLIMTSLRRKLAIAEEEGWMYGDNDSGANGEFGFAAGLEGDGFD